MAPKKKAQKMALSEFFADTTSGDWADEMDFLPTAPAPRDPNAPLQRGDPGYLASMPDRGARTFPGAPPSRVELPLPTVPPFTAFIGNLTFETEEQELVEFFGDLEAFSARLVKDNTGRPKGFGYVEFPSQEKLKTALERNGSQMAGRTIRISVAEPPSTSRHHAPSAAEESNQWRRTGPLPARDLPAAPRRGPSFSDGPERGPDRDWGSARGARFTPTASPNLGRRESGGMGRSPFVPAPSVADDADQWRSSRPTVEARREPERSPSMADTEQVWSRGAKVRAAEPPSRDTTASPGELATPTEERDWRSRDVSAIPSGGSGNTSVDGESPRVPPAPLERKKLQLAPRTLPTPDASSPTTATAADPNAQSGKQSSIFGSAKPVDSASRERQVEERLAQKEVERKEAEKKAREEAEKKAKEEEESVKKFAEDRAKSIRDAQEKARAEIAAKSGGAANGPTSPNPNSNTNGNRPYPNRRTSSNTSHHQQHPGQGQGQGQGRRQSAKSPNPQVGEDGFTSAAQGSRQRNPSQPNIQASAPPPPAATARPKAKQGFSFADAMREGLVDEGQGEGEGDEAEVEGEGEGKKDGVEEITKKVEGVAV